MQSKLSFISETHEYFLELKRLPSVSEIMRPLTEPSLSCVPLKQLEIARDRGTKVHKAIENWIKDKTFDDEVGDYLDQFILFLSENDLEVVESEIMLTDGVYAGTLDLIVKTPTNDLYVVDTKTTYAISTYVPVQLAAYDWLARFNGYDIKRCYVLHLKADYYNFTFRNTDVQKWGELLEEFTNKSDQYTK